MSFHSNVYVLCIVNYHSKCFAHTQQTSLLQICHRAIMEQICYRSIFETVTELLHNIGDISVADKLALNMFLNQVRTWFLEITFVQTLVCVCV